ncbi:autotransporter outer membrane beta-barrel domain-containing protein [Hyphomicrobium sp. 1Nfss2.1]|uniref:autotransporter family protein n=1 Tax=Hyphomicrobium sp. 1Nfss2.1 TaxID=3413936 RepID=UPI003C7E19A1
MGLAAALALIVPLSVFWVSPAAAGCSAAPISGGLDVICEAAIPPDPVNVPIVIPAGNNSLAVASGSYVDFEFLGNGTSTTTFTGGTTSAGITTHDGVDFFTMTGGAIAGTVSQGDGVDTFTMSAGSVGAVDQGGGLDTFVMTGGTIVGAFTDGDSATIRGGTIGSVDMNVGNNVFFMSGGTIVGDVVTRQNNDTFTLVGGSIGGEVDLGNGTNSFTMSGGTIGNGVTTGTGTDTFAWSGGAITGSIGLGAGADRATLSNLGAANLAGTTLIDGGAGTDLLSFAHSVISGIARFQNWETVALASGSYVALDSDFVLGGADTGTGSLSIDASSTLYADGASSAITPFTSGQLVLVTNAGTIDLANGSPGDTLTVVGSYVGQGGRLQLDTRLGSDASPSDKLVIDSGTATGGTGIAITNVGGSGAKTVASGILIIDTVNGATTAAGAFALAGPVVAGPYEYSLYRGAADGSAPDNWYLRSTLEDDTPAYRSEASLYTALPAMMLLYGRLMLDTLHERMGDEFSGFGGNAERGWGRVIGQHGDHDGHALGIYGDGPAFDYDFWALQAGSDFFRSGEASGAGDRAGAFFAIGNATGDVDHFDGSNAGRDTFMAYSFGGYWTHFTAEGAYLDALLIGTWYDTDAKSTRLPKLTSNGAGVGASLEAGYPLLLSGGFSVEPQAQVAFQTVDISDASDIGAAVRFANANSLLGRIGARFVKTSSMAEFGGVASGVFTSWVRPSLWYEFLGDPTTSFSSEQGFVPFTADLFGPTLALDAGFTAQVSADTAIYASASYQIGLGAGAEGDAYNGKIGVKLGW